MAADPGKQPTQAPANTTQLGPQTFDGDRTVPTTFAFEKWMVRGQNRLSIAASTDDTWATAEIEVRGSVDDTDQYTVLGTITGEGITEYAVGPYVKVDLALTVKEGSALEIVFTGHGWFRPFDDPKNFGLEVIRGNVDGVVGVNKFGEALDCDNGVATDIWDGADGSTSTDIWVAPTTARVHNVASTDAFSDTGGGTGILTVRVYGLKTWASAETSEDITMNGTTPVATSNSYVIVHRLQGLTFGSGGTNVGTITATAVTDLTITAAIQPGEGQSLMAIYGVPTGKTLAINRIVTSVLKSTGGTIEVDATLLVTADASVDPGALTRERWTFQEIDQFHRDYDPPKQVAGPAIVKIQVEADTNNSACTAAFDGYLVDD